MASVSHPLVQELERERAAAALEQACVRDSALEAIGADLTAGAAAARDALGASAKLEVALAHLADVKVVMHAALLELQARQAAAIAAAHVGKAPSGAYLSSVHNCQLCQFCAFPFGRERCMLYGLTKRCLLRDR